VAGKTCSCVFDWKYIYIYIYNEIHINPKTSSFQKRIMCTNLKFKYFIKNKLIVVIWFERKCPRKLFDAKVMDFDSMLGYLGNILFMVEYSQLRYVPLVLGKKFPQVYNFHLFPIQILVFKFHYITINRWRI